VRKRKIIEVND